MTIVLLYLLTGASAGFLAGLFGIGGGVVMVPLLALAFHIQGVAPALIIHLAIGTSLACICVTAIASTRAHYQQGGVRTDWLVRLLPGLIGGAIIGVFIGDALSAGLMHALLGVFFLLVAAKMWRNDNPSGEAGLPGPAGMVGAGSVIGTVSALFGVGGGALTVPFLSWRGAAMKQAVGTSAATGIPIALIGTLTSAIVGADRADLPAWTTGYVNWAAFAAVAVLSMPMARVGARVAHRLPSRLLKRCFAVLLTLVAIKLLF